jgi:hypothetical protein
MFEVHDFEYVAAEPDVALVRLAGVWSDDSHPPAECPLLVLDAGEDDEWFQPLPQAADPDRWRAAYSVPARIIESPGARFLLVPPTGKRIELPPPIEHGTAAREIAAIRAELDRERSEHEATSQRAAELEALLQGLRSRIERGDDRLREIERRAEDLRSAIRAKDSAPA